MTISRGSFLVFQLYNTLPYFHVFKARLVHLFISECVLGYILINMRDCKDGGKYFQYFTGICTASC